MTNTLRSIGDEKTLLCCCKRILNKPGKDKNSLSAVRTKFSCGVHSVAYGGYLYLLCAVCDVTIWRHIHVSKPTFWRRYAYSSTRTLHILCVIALNINYQRSKWGYRRKYTQRYDTAVHKCKNIRLSVKTGEWNTHSLRQSIYNYNFCVKSTN